MLLTGHIIGVTISIYSTTGTTDIDSMKGFVGPLHPGERPRSLGLGRFQCPARDEIKASPRARQVPSRRNIINVSAAGAEVAPALDALAEELGWDLETGLTGPELLQLRTTSLKVNANLTPLRHFLDGCKPRPACWHSDNASIPRRFSMFSNEITSQSHGLCTSGQFAG
jgi:hypothetical protein